MDWKDLLDFQSHPDLLQSEIQSLNHGFTFLKDISPHIAAWEPMQPNRLWLQDASASLLQEAICYFRIVVIMFVQPCLNPCTSSSELVNSSRISHSLFYCFYQNNS